MAGSITSVLRHYIELVERAFNGAKDVTKPAEFGVVLGKNFEESLRKLLPTFPDLKEKLAKFIDTKKADPLHSRYGKHDRPFASGTPLAGYQHCHLRDDAILVYTLKNRNINLLLICNHAEIEGKATGRTANKLATS